MSDHAAIVRKAIRMHPDDSTDEIWEAETEAFAALAALEQELAAALLDRDHWYQHPESDCEYHKRMVAAEAERDEAQRLAVTASEECEEWRKKAGVTEYHLLRRHATEKRLVDEEDRAEAAEAEVARLRNVQTGIGPDDPSGCPAGHGPQCCGHHDACRAALAEDTP